MENNSTNKPSVLKPWMKYYPAQLIENLHVPACSLGQYMMDNMPGLDVPAINFYDNMISWRTFFENAEHVAKGLKAVGFKTGDQVPAFVKSTPEFFALLFGCELIGASLLIRDNEWHENAETLRNSGVDTMFTNDCISQEEAEYYLAHTGIKKIITIPLTASCDRKNMPDYVQHTLDSFYDHECAHGDAIMTWSDFLAEGERYTGEFKAPLDCDRPLFRCYTSGSTGPSKQVIHSAHTIIGALAQMNFYGSQDSFRPTWLVTVLPPCLVSVVISFLLLPLSSNKLMILDPFCAPEDVDLEVMRCKPNCWPSIPMFCDILSNSKRVPADYDMSHLFSCGAGCEHMNNNQIRRFQKFLKDHHSTTRFTTGYGSSEAGSNVGFHMTDTPLGNGNVGCPMPLTDVAICKPGTTEELGFNQTGEICVHSPNVMLGYDNAEATAKALRRHEDGNIWLHTGDVGYMTEEGILFTQSRGSSKRKSGGFLDILPMENAVADAHIDGIVDEFFVNVPDTEYSGYYNPYLFVVLEDGYAVNDISDKVLRALPEQHAPVDIRALPQRPYWHFKTHRISKIREILGETDTAAYPSNMA